MCLYPPQEENRRGVLNFEHLMCASFVIIAFPLSRI